MTDSGDSGISGDSGDSGISGAPRSGGTRWSDSDALRAIRSILADREDALFTDAETLLGFDTQNPPGRTREAIAHLHESLDREELETEVVAADPEKPNLLVTIPGESPATLLYVGHVDTVPYESAEWTHDPLGEWVEGEVGDGEGDEDRRGREDDRRLYGRGGTDMKGAVAAMVAVARAFADAGVTPPITLQFAFVSDEETGGDAGFDYLLDEDALSADACIVGETTCEGGRHSVAVADRGSVWLTLDARGDPAHGSRPALGVNAIDRLYAAVEAIHERLADYPLALSADLDPILRESVAFYESRMGERVARETFEHPTVNLGTISGGHAINAVPTDATAEVDVRVTASTDARGVLDAIETTLADHAGVEIAAVSLADGTYESLDSPLVTAVTEAAEVATADRIYRRSATGGGDAKKLRNAGVPTVEMGFGTDTAHAIDEYTTAAALRNNAALYARVPYALRDRWR